MKQFIGISVFFLTGLIAVWLLFFNVLYPIKYRQTIIEAGQTYNVDPVLIASVINAESGFDYTKVSSKNAVGLMQLLPSTAETLTTQSEIDLLDPTTNITLGVKYLAYLIKKFGDTDTALFAYNAGEGNVAKWLTEQNTKQLKTCPFKETNAYVAKIKNSIKFYQGRF